MLAQTVVSQREQDRGQVAEAAAYSATRFSGEILAVRDVRRVIFGAALPAASGCLFATEISRWESPT
jgi:hypothetical protein